MTVHYIPPSKWLIYDIQKVAGPLIEAKASVISLTNIPYQKTWAEKLQAVQLKQEVAGTSKIEGADFTDKELDAALNEETAQEALTRSQRQARSAVNTYRWIAKLPLDRPIDDALIYEVHARLIENCDDDHCPPGKLRDDGENVTFGTPRHRGVEGGKECKKSFNTLIQALNREFSGHDILVRALALHYHIGAMHPFLDGNGRTARAVEALLLQRAGLRAALFIALSNYYYDEKATYLKCLALVPQSGGDLTEFLVFGLTGIAVQCRRLLSEINRHLQIAMFRDMATDLFGRMANKRKRVIADRQLMIINSLLERGATDLGEMFKLVRHAYNLKEPWTAFVGDIIALIEVGAVFARRVSETDNKKKAPGPVLIDVDLDWPTKVTETEFFEKTREMPRAKTFKFLHH